MLIRQARVMDPVSGMDRVADVRICGDRIEKIGQELEIQPDEQVIEARGLVLAPGLIDTHVHFRDPGQTHKEDIFTGAAAAARGGFTTVVCMANTSPVVDNSETLAYCLEKGRKTGIHVLQAACVTKGMQGKELCDFSLLAKAGAAGFTDDGKPITDARLLMQAMEEAKKLDMPISLHEEDPAFVPGAGVNAGVISERIGYAGAMALAEDELVARDCTLAEHTGACVCMQHISSAGAVQLIREAKARGVDVHAEATPHHFTLTEEAVLEYGTNARMNPPLRTEKDREAIIEGLKDGTIELIVTDHAPHSREEKERPMAQAMSGITGLETSLALGIRSLVQPGHLSLMKLLECMSVNPARLYHLPVPRIAEGVKADLVLFGENEEWTASEFASRSDNTPFKGWVLPGRVHRTICDGRIVYSSET
ncbi:MAG: dihydroorotase [Lachnospiraceae bacterium]|nr:dihydroorotase [Lachnospiraceae bacterium]